MNHLKSPVQGWPIVLGAPIENPNPITVDDLTGTAATTQSSSSTNDGAEQLQREKQAAERAERERREKQAAERAERERELAARAEREREEAAARAERDAQEEVERQAANQRYEDEQRRRQESDALLEEARQSAIEAERLLEAKRALESHSAQQYGVEPVSDAETAWYADQETQRQWELSQVSSKLDAARYRVNLVC